MYDKTPYFYGTGRRKSSVARVRLYQGTGKSQSTIVTSTIISVLKHSSSSLDSLSP